VAEQLIHGALFFLEPSETIRRAETLMDGALLGVVTSRGEGFFYASLCRIRPLYYEQSSIAPLCWSSHAISRVLCGSVAEGWQLVERAFASLTDTYAPNYSLKSGPLRIGSV
jgi:hypothetical protein